MSRKLLQYVFAYFAAEIEVSGCANIYLVNTSFPLRMYEKPPDFGNDSSMSICNISAGIRVFELTGDSCGCSA